MPALKLPAFYETFLYLVLFWVSLATSWNILSGYAGYFSFGHAAFFGAGVYTTATLTTQTSTAVTTTTVTVVTTPNTLTFTGAYGTGR